MIITLRHVTSTTEIRAILMFFNTAFPRSIESRVHHLDSYAEKLARSAFTYIAEENQSYVGLVIFYANDHSSKLAYLSQIAVAKKYQNRGIGRLLLQQAFLTAAQHGMSMIKLEVDYSNRKAIVFYEKHGFKLLGQASPYSQHMIKELS